MESANFDVTGTRLVAHGMRRTAEGAGQMAAFRADLFIVNWEARTRQLLHSEYPRSGGAAPKIQELPRLTARFLYIGARFGRRSPANQGGIMTGKMVGIIGSAGLLLAVGCGGSSSTSSSSNGSGTTGGAAAGATSGNGTGAGSGSGSGSGTGSGGIQGPQGFNPSYEALSFKPLPDGGADTSTLISVILSDYTPSSCGAGQALPGANQHQLVLNVGTNDGSLLQLGSFPILTGLLPDGGLPLVNGQLVAYLGDSSGSVTMYQGQSGTVTLTALGAVSASGSFTAAIANDVDGGLTQLSGSFQTTVPCPTMP